MSSGTISDKLKKPMPTDNNSIYEVSLMIAILVGLIAMAFYFFYQLTCKTYQSEDGEEKGGGNGESSNSGTNRRRTLGTKELLEVKTGH